MPINQGDHFVAEVTDRRVMADLIAEDVLAEENVGVIGYDNSPEVRNQAEILTASLEAQFQDVLARISR